MMAVATTSNERERSPAAERVRLHRRRRSIGVRCLTIELREIEIDDLIRRGLLPSESRTDRAAVVGALYKFLDMTLSAQAIRAANR
jgi:hypothetical protein